MQPLDTSVKGSPGTLSASADFLDHYAQALDGVGQDMTNVNNTREADWHGPASEACGDALNDIDSDDVDDLKTQVRNVARAERDFEHALNAVIDQMQQATSIATGAGLSTNGPLIMPPNPPGPAPHAPMGPFAIDKAQGVANKFKADIAAHQAACADYNRKLAAYNQGKGIIDKARTDEQNAHNTLDDSIKQSGTHVSQLKTIGAQAITWAATYVKTFHGSAKDLLDAADKAIDTGKIYEAFNSGNLITLSAAEQEVIDWGKSHAQALSDQYTQKADQFETFVARVPKWAKTTITANAGDTMAALAKDAKFLKWAKPVLKGIPYFGTLAGAGSNIYDAASGEKSWSRAGIDFGAETAGGALGGALGGAVAGALAGSELPGIGTAIGGVVGGVLGTTGADSIVDSIASPKPPDPQAQKTYNQYDFGSSTYQYPG